MLNAALLFVMIIFTHFEMIAIGGFPVTLGAASGLLLVVRLSRIPFAQLSTVWAVVVALASLAAMTASLNAAFLEVFRTLALFLASSAIITVGIYGTRLELLKRRLASRALLAALVLITTLSVAQVAAGAAGSEAFFNVFGSRQYLYEYNPYLQFNPIPRPQGFFLEPSYNAFVIGSLAVCLICLGRHRRLASVLGLVGLIITQSATALVIVTVLIVLYTIGGRPARALVGLAAAAALFLLGGDYLVSRLASTTTVSSSANYRLLAPLDVLRDVLDQQPFGQPLGSIEAVFASYGLRNGTERGVTLDNGYYVLVYYFGYLGIVLLAVFVAFMIKIVVKGLAARSVAWVAPVWVTGSLLFSGGIMLPEFALMLWLIVVCHRSIIRTREEPSSSVLKVSPS